MTERVTYERIKEWFFDAFYSYCCNIISSKKRGRISYSNAGEMYSGAIGFAYEEYGIAYDLPIEKLMLEITVLIVTAGYASEKTESYHRNIINKILSENSLDELISDLSEDEKRDLLSDMSLLDLI